MENTFIYSIKSTASLTSLALQLWPIPYPWNWKSFLFDISILLFSNCQEKNKEHSVKANYLDFSKRDDQFTGGIKWFPSQHQKAPLKCGQNRGNNPTIVLLLHGGPGLTHELYECFDGYFPNESIEYIYYDQLILLQWPAKW
jgi:hypothetical protein